MRAVFADPRTDLIFKRIFGREANSHLLIELLNTLLELDQANRILGIQALTPEQKVPVAELKLSVVDVKCFDCLGQNYVVKMQLLNVEGFEKKVVYNVTKAPVTRLGIGENYPALCDVVGVTICDFELWPKLACSNGRSVPMLSRWMMQEQHGQVVGPQVQYVFLELPKYTAGSDPESTLDKWAFFFREAKNLSVIPPALDEDPFRDALDIARTASFTDQEREAYDRAKIAEQDARGALALAHRMGMEEGLAEGRKMGRQEGIEKSRQEDLEKGQESVLRKGVFELCQVFGIELTAERRADVEAMNLEKLEGLRSHLINKKTWVQPSRPPSRD